MKFNFNFFVEFYSNYVTLNVKKKSSLNVSILVMIMKIKKTKYSKLSVWAIWEPLNVKFYSKIQILY